MQAPVTTGDNKNEVMTIMGIFMTVQYEEFSKMRNQDLLKAPYTYGFMLNCDWFQPYKRREDVSVGVLYMVLMNLPIQERFKREIVILVGIIPSLNKEPSSLNAFHSLL